MGDGAPMTRLQAAAEILRRDRAVESLVDFAQAIEIPGAPMSDDPNEWIFKPLGSKLAYHHRVFLEAIQRCIETDSGRLMIFAPPGAAKSTYASVVAPAWAMGRRPRFKSIMVSYAAVPAERQAKRCRSIVASEAYASIWPSATSLLKGTTAANDWELTNGSGMIASGILGAVTSNRADLLVIDDPVAGRQEADSETTRRNIRQAYDDDLLTRIKPNASIILMMTRWHLDDLAGSILPEDYDGRSGPVLCRDGQIWEVLSIPARSERTDDPLGRPCGAYLWPEWFNARHWANFESNARTWSALFQQRPQYDSGGQFEKGWFDRYTVHPEVSWYGSSDFAVTKKTMDTHPDHTEHGMFGIDEAGEIWVQTEDWWSGQEAPDVTIEAMLKMVEMYKPLEWLSERGVIKNAIEGAISRAMRESDRFVTMTWMPTGADKIAKVAAFRARASAGTVHIQKGQKGDALIAQLCAFPFARFDDKVDACGQVGRFIDEMYNVPVDKAEVVKAIVPFTAQWLEYADTVEREEREQRERELS